MNTVYQINNHLTWAAQKHDVITKLLPLLKRKINKKYKVTGAEIIKMLQRCHRSCHRKKKRRRRAVDFMMQGGNKYIKRYLKKDLIKILNNSSYHLEEWKETNEGTTIIDSDNDTNNNNNNTSENFLYWRFSVPITFVNITFMLEIFEDYRSKILRSNNNNDNDNNNNNNNSNEKIISIYIYEKWWRSDYTCRQNY
ncbi:hypothetical protein Glove_114g65 [Diversispora epigaea]|uniref:Uncharacterized protein n=1 Tax=Diversispora epigaea TaxID=1348612 RepID=A0A397J1B3_9GLOM|nr:hypothetical protein Glove_114g65 [Diversispora epigaea]